MKVQDVNMSLREMQSPAHLEKSAGASNEHPFHRNLTSLNEATYRQRIEDLVDSITKQGDLLGRRADIKELQKYREMITELMNETVSNSYVFTKNNAFDSRGRHRVYAMIKKVNSNLDEIAQQVLSEQADNLSVLHLVDDIRGLLLDIFL